MAGTFIEFAALFLFIILFVGVILAEVQWLIRKGWATSGRALAFVLLTDLLGFFVGGGVVFVAFGAMFMMVMGPAGRGSTVPEAAYWVITALAVIVPPILLFFLKRGFLLIFKMRSGGPAWVFSLVSSLAVPLIVLVPPSALLYLVVTLWKL